jgi:hypothetical protein
MSERLSRKQFLKIAAITGGAIILSGCIPDREKAQFIPLEQILKDPEKHKDVKNLATVGFPEQIGENTFYTPIPIYQTQRIGDMTTVTLVRFDWVTTTKETYLLHTSRSINSPSIRFTTRNVTYFPILPLKPSGDNLPTEPFQITGKLDVVKIKDKNGDGMQEVYAIDVFSITPLVTPTAPLP